MNKLTDFKCCTFRVTNIYPCVIGAVLIMEDEEVEIEDENECEVAALRLRAESLKQELKECRAELAKLQKQLSHSERLQKSTESYNEDLRKQVSPLKQTI